MRLSIVVPIYNTELYLEACLQSIMGQNCDDMEIVLVNDGSTDGCDRICREYAGRDERIIYVKQENRGLIAARRTGVEHASGEFLMFVDSDDWIDCGMVEFLLDRMGEADLATTGVHYETGPEMETEYLDQYPEGEYRGPDKEIVLKTMLYDRDSDSLQRLTPWIWNKLYRTETARAVYRRLQADHNFAEDAAFLYNYLVICGAVRICHTCFYHYRYRTDSMFHGGNPHMLSDINKAYLAVSAGFATHPLRENLMSQLQHWVSIMAVMAVNGGMGFSPQIHIPEFQIDTEGLKGKKIVLYGAGKVGRDWFRQLTLMGYDVVLWVDSSHSQIENVKAPSALTDTEYDVIIPAVSRPEYVKGIRLFLQDIGIGEEKLLYKKTYRTL